MPHREKWKPLVDDKLAEDLNTVVSFLTMRSKIKADKLKLWSWRRMIAFVLISSVIGWSLVLGLLYLIFTMWD